MIIIAGTASHDEKDDDIWLKYISDSAVEGQTILDGMMGGGTTIVESLRLRAKVVGSDINPVAWFVTKKEIEPIDPKKMEEAFRQLEDSVGREVKRLYRTTCTKGHDSDIMYALWHKRIGCANCKEPINIVTESLVSERRVNVVRRIKGRERKVTELRLVIACPRCDTIFPRNRDVKTKIKCPKCSFRFNPRKGTSSRGNIRCLNCGHQEKMSDAVKRKGGPVQFKMFCIEYYCNVCKGRGYKRPSSDDIRLYEEASRQLQGSRDTLEIPREAIPESSKEARPKNHGYNYFHQLFNDRQLLSLSKLLQAIRRINDKNTREFILLAFSACLETNNVFCSYETRWRKAGAMFSLPGYHPLDRYAENNVWGTTHGRGTFVRSYLKVIRAKTQGLDVGSRNSLHSIPPAARFTQLARTFDELQNSEKNAMLVCGTSESLEFVPDQSIGLVATDPPYFDTLNYSRLADFFYVWLKIALEDEYAAFKPSTSFRDREVVMVGASIEKRRKFVDSLSRVFKEYKRVLAPSGLMVFTFHHTAEWAWQDLAGAVKEGGFSITACHFVRSEGRTGFRKSGHISYDACLVCRKSEEATTNESQEEVLTQSKDWVRRLFRAGNGLEDSDVLSIVMGNSLTRAPSLLSDAGVKGNRIQKIQMACVDYRDTLKERLRDQASKKRNLVKKSRQARLSA